MPTSRTLTISAGILAAVAFLNPGSVAQSTRTPDGRWHRVDSNNAFVRSDASATVAYPVGRVPRGTMVLVLEDRFGWAKVRPTGDAFDSLHAFVVAEHATVLDGESVRIDVRTPLKAANFAAREDPTRSWKEIARLEPGETLEDAVRREVFEETGVHVGAVDYFGNQPWPLPASLMLGFVARAESTAIEVDREELEEARWFTRAEMREQAEAGSLVLPGGVSISRSLIKHWYGGPLPGQW